MVTSSIWIRSKTGIVKNIFGFFLASLLAFDCTAIDHPPAQALKISKPSFIDELIDDEDYFRALTLLKQEEFEYRGTPKAAHSARRALGVLILAKDYDEATDWLPKIMTRYSPFFSDFDWPRMKGELALLYGNYPESFSLLNTGKNSALPITHIAAIATNPDTPLPSLDSCADPALCPIIERIYSEYKSEAPKNPSLALGLGIIPGLGQVYAGSFYAGLTSFILNGLLISATLYGANHGETAFAIVTGTVGAGFYFGSLYAGYEMAKRNNEARVEHTRTSLRGLSIQFEVLRFGFP